MAIDEITECLLVLQALTSLYRASHGVVNPGLTFGGVSYEAINVYV
jgi:hypothetical protein